MLNALNTVALVIGWCVLGPVLLAVLCGLTMAAMDGLGKVRHE